MSVGVADELRCRGLVELITDYLEGVLPTPDARRFEAHLADCDDCSTYVEQMRQTIEAIGQIPPESLSAEASEHLLWTFRDWRGSR
ncbi:MAG: zf-HC2 domain-containing protein [bacterium]